MTSTGTKQCSSKSISKSIKINEEYSNNERAVGGLKPFEKNTIDDFNLPRSVRWFIFIVFVFMNILMNIDHGTIPAATYKIITDLSINDLIVI